MSWRDYYRLYEKYDGDLRKASCLELEEAFQANPNDPFMARALAFCEYHRQFTDNVKDRQTSSNS
jgi:hypothetical protein